MPESPAEVYKEWSKEYNLWMEKKLGEKSRFGGEYIQPAPPKTTWEKVKEKLAETFSGSKFSEMLQGYHRTYNPKTGRYELAQKDPETGEEISVYSGETIKPANADLGILQQVTRVALIILVGLIGVMALFQAVGVNPVSAVKGVIK